MKVTHRLVEITIPRETYSIEFLEGSEDDGYEGFSAETACLCTLGEAVEVWMKGGTAEDVQERMAHNHPKQIE